MDKAKTKLATSKLATFFETNEDEDTTHPNVFSTGTVKKSKREKEQEAAEAKKREEEASAAKAYAEFLDAFEGDDGRRSTSTFLKAESRTTYAPAFRNPPNEPSRHRRKSPSPPSAPKPKGKRAMDSFLEEIKRDQAEREARFSRNVVHGRSSATAMAAYEGQSGSKDRGDPQTSNIFVANLPPHVTEQTLGNFFARAGPVGSVKIMWPRADGPSGPGADARRAKNTALSGFVSFMKRKDAEAALREFDGFDWGGSILRVGWSKAVPMAAKPLYVSSVALPARSRSRSPPRRSSSRDRYHSHRSRSRSRSRSYSRSRSRSPRWRRDSRSRSPRRRSRSPTPPNVEDEVTDTFIRAVAAEVRNHGEKFAATLMERERNNPKYSFLLSKDRRHSFYRDLVEDDRMEGAEFDDEGYNSIYSSDSAEDSEREKGKKTILGRLARKRFEAMLRGLSGKRGEIARCMAFSLEHAEAANEVADIIVSSLLVEGTPVPRKVARLHLICDILHNSAASVPSAWKFRLEFQSKLGIVFDHLSNIYHSFPGRITAEMFKKQITAIIDIWEDWIVFPPEFTQELRFRLDGAYKEEEEQSRQQLEQSHEDKSSYASRFKTSTFHAADSAAETQDEGADDLDGEPVDDMDGVPINDDVDGEAMEDVDGEPLDVDGEPMEDMDGEPMEDLDGEPMEDLDGEPMEDIDGEPLDS